MSEAGFPHGFTLRAAPDGTPLDFAFARQNARVSEELLGAALGISPSRLYEVTQVHGNAVAFATGDAEALRAVSADALVLRREVFEANDPAARAAVGVRIADCVPIVVADLATGDVAAIHAGWRGVVQGVVPAALRELALGRKLAAIGPCIGICCFEVRRDVGDEIAAATDACVLHASASPEKAMIDLRMAVRRQLLSAGLADEDIEDVGGCTRCEGARFHSYRREGEASGRMIGVISPRR